MPYKTPLWGPNAGRLIWVKPSKGRPKGLRQYQRPRNELEAQNRAFWEQHAGHRGGQGEKLAPVSARVEARSDPRSRRPG